MKRFAFIFLLVPVLFLGTSVAGPWEKEASADRGGRGREGVVLRGGSRGGDAVIRHGGRDGGVYRSRDAVVRYSGRGDYSRRGEYVRHGGHRHSHSHFSTSLWFGPAWGWSAWDPWYYPSYRYPYYYGYYAPQTTVVVPREPEEYIMKDPEDAEPAGYWYYCKGSNGYYPYVERCPGGWLKVVPQPPPDQSDDDED